VVYARFLQPRLDAKGISAHHAVSNVIGLGATVQMKDVLFHVVRFGPADGECSVSGGFNFCGVCFRHGETAKTLAYGHTFKKLRRRFDP